MNGRTRRAVECTSVALGIATLFGVGALIAYGPCEPTGPRSLPVAAAAVWADWVGHTMWLDEVHTWLLVTDPSATHMLRALASGADYNAPAVYLLIRAFAAPLGRVDPFVLHLYSLSSILLAAAGTYASLRRSFETWPALTGVLAAFGHPLAVYHAFEARYYGTWLAALAWLAYFLGRAKASPRPWRAALPVALLSVLVCTTHYLGLLSVGLLVGADALFDRRPPVARLRTAAAALAGPVALLACLPIMRGQRASLPGGITWVGFDARWIFAFLEGMAPRGLVIALAVAAAFVAVPRLRRPGQLDLRAQAGPLALLLLPLVLIAFSWAVQPVLVDRYGIATLLGIAPIAALLTARMVWPAAIALGTVFAAIVSVQAAQHARFTASIERDLEAASARIGRFTQPTDVVIFDSRHLMWPLWARWPELRSRTYLMDFDPSRRFSFPPHQAFEADVARAVKNAYPGGPSLLAEHELLRRDRFFIVAADPDAWRLQIRFSGFAARRQEDQLFLLARFGR